MPNGNAFVIVELMSEPCCVTLSDLFGDTLGDVDGNRSRRNDFASLFGDTLGDVDGNRSRRNNFASTSSNELSATLGSGVGPGRDSIC